MKFTKCVIVLTLLVFVSGQILYTIKCPKAETLTGINVNQLTGKWHAVQTMLMKTSDTNNEAYPSEECVDLNIDYSRDRNLSFAFDIKFQNNTDMVKKVTHAIFRIHNRARGFTVDLLDRNKNLYAFMMHTEPSKYLVLLHCTIIDNIRYIATATLFSRVTSEGLIITDNEKLIAVENLLQKTGASAVQSSYQSETCYSNN